MEEICPPRNQRYATDNTEDRILDKATILNRNKITRKVISGRKNTRGEYPMHTHRPNRKPYRPPPMRN